MKKLFLLIILISITAALGAQSIVFTDNFESGTSNWALNGTWGLTTSQSHSSSHSLTESPIGNYADNINISATMTTGVNLSSSLSADVSFWAKYSIEGGFDYMYLDVSPNGGTTWINIDAFDDTLSVWTQFNYSLGGYVGNSNVKIRFRFVSDGGLNMDGMYIDDFVITSDTVDNASPLILHTSPVLYNGTDYQDSVMADIIDISGVQIAELNYRIDGGVFSMVTGINTSGNTYKFIIPQQQGGAMVDYFFHAVDSAVSSNTATTDTFSFIAGNYISYDSGVTDFVDSTGPGSGAAIRVSLSGASNLNSILLRNYTDINRPNDSMLVHVWNSSLGAPGTDLITPFMVKPMANLQNTSPMTTIDLRPYAAQLSNLTGDIFIGFTVPSGGVWITITRPGTANRSFKLSGTTWANATGTSGIVDFHFRAVTSAYIPPPVVSFSFDTTNAPTISFTDLTTPTATAWAWDFGDGATDNTQNPIHTYANYGTYIVWLVATTPTGTDSSSTVVSFSQAVPVADFGYTFKTPSIIEFTDSSLNTPIQWLWDFGNGKTSTQQNPVDTFITGGYYNVCLTATNAAGSSSAYCETVIVYVGIDNPYENQVGDFYPNPIYTKSFIEIEGVNSSNIVLKAYDMQGKEVTLDHQILQNGIEINRGNLSKGHYIFEIYMNNQRIKTGRLIVQ